MSLSTRDASLIGFCIVLSLLGCASVVDRPEGPKMAPAGQAGRDDQGSEMRPPEADGVRCDDDQQHESGDLVEAACAFDRGKAAERAAVIAAENKATQDYAVDLDSYMSRPDMQAYIAEVRELPQPARAERAQYLLEHNHVLLTCAFDQQHAPDYRHTQGSYVFTVSCDPLPHGTIP